MCKMLQLKCRGYATLRLSKTNKTGKESACTFIVSCEVGETASVSVILVRLPLNQQSRALPRGPAGILQNLQLTAS